MAKRSPTPRKVRSLFFENSGAATTYIPVEAFLLFSQDIPTANLGFVDSRATSVEVTIRGNEFAIHQSPTLLSSVRAGGTTGAGKRPKICTSPRNPPCTDSSTPAVGLIAPRPGGTRARRQASVHAVPHLTDSYYRPCIGALHPMDSLSRVTSSLWSYPTLY